MENTTDMKDHDLLISLNSKMDSVLERLDKVDDLDKRVRDLEINMGAIRTDLNTNKSEVEKLRNTNVVWSTILSILSGISLYLGFK